MSRVLNDVRIFMLRHLEVLRHGTAATAVAVLGWVVGWFVGQSGSDATVLAAVLPAVLSGGGFLIVLRSEERYTPRDGIIVNLLVVVFVVLLLFGSSWGRFDLEKDDAEALKQTLKRESEYREQEDSKHRKRELQFRDEYLKNCSAQEVRVNSLRRASGLPPLPSEVFCR